MNSSRDLILLHGALGSQQQFDPFSELLKSHFTIHSFDLPGHGGQSLPNKFSIPHFANALNYFIEGHQLHQVYVFGYSMGGYIALHLAHMNPGMINRIFTLGTMLRWSPEIAEREVKMMDPDIIESKVPRFAEQLKKRHAPEDWKEIMRKTADMMLELGRGAAMTMADFQQIDIPVCIGLGSLDQMAGKEDSIEVARHLRFGSFHSFEGFRHPIEGIDLGVLAQAVVAFGQVD